MAILRWTSRITLLGRSSRIVDSPTLRRGQAQSLALLNFGKERRRASELERAAAEREPDRQAVAVRKITSRRGDLEIRRARRVPTTAGTLQLQLAVLVGRRFDAQRKSDRQGVAVRCPLARRSVPQGARHTWLSGGTRRKGRAIDTFNIPPVHQGKIVVTKRLYDAPITHACTSAIYFSYSARDIRMPSRSTRARSFAGKTVCTSSMRFHGAKGVSHVERGTNSDGSTFL